jgi:D-tagatose-1,6-bisphosphate aldolase subunit GatZ/KbaZ
MYLDGIVSAQKRGEAKGITSVCSAHPFVIKETLKVSKTFRVSPLIEATCNQVNQFGGYTGMTPKDFVAYVRGLAEEINFPFENIILGGDHLGPNVWQKEPAESAMQKSEEMIRQYVQAGFTKLHLDCSMRLVDDPPGALDVEVVALRAARLAKVAEQTGVDGGLRYIIGTEVPVPGGAVEHEEGVSVTKVEDAKQTIEVTREAFLREGLAEAWERVLGVVVQPGVEFGDDFVLQYDPVAARELSKFIESQAVLYEAHSTDYQTRQALKDLVRDHFAILKVGPALTFAFREAVFALAMMENELIAESKRSDVIQVLDAAMATHPEHWINYYRGTEDEQKYKRKYSLSDRARYYWGRPDVQTAYKRLMDNLGSDTLPYSLLSQFGCQTNLTAGQVIAIKVRQVLENYFSACDRPELPFGGQVF